MFRGALLGFFACCQRDRTGRLVILCGGIRGHKNILINQTLEKILAFCHPAPSQGF